MSRNMKYWLWVQKSLGEGFHIHKIKEVFNSVEELYNSNILERRIGNIFTSKQLERIENITLDDVEDIIYTCEQNGWQIIDYDDKRYPQRLREIINPPAVLYVDGEMPEFDRLVTVGIVGTRHASDYAVKVTHLISRGVTEAGALVVSGGALGIDTYAHRGALMAGGKTVAVMGCGFGANYLETNRQLRDMIRKNGALITEYPPFTPAGKHTFPLRNRIISGLSLGVLVVEAGVRSGSLITAKYAEEQNRDVYAVPGSLLSVDFAGSNKLIEDGAGVVTKPEHLVEQYASMYKTLDVSKIRSIEELMSDETDYSANVQETQDRYSFEKLDESREKRAELEREINNLSDDMQRVYYSMSNRFEHIDVIIENSGLADSKVNSALIQLEVLGLVESASGKRYKQV